MLVIELYDDCALSDFSVLLVNQVVEAYHRGL